MLYGTRTHVVLPNPHQAAKSTLTRELILNGTAVLPFDDNGFLATDEEIIAAAAKIDGTSST
jgi:hypothetical protein